MIKWSYCSTPGATCLCWITFIRGCTLDCSMRRRCRTARNSTCCRSPCSACPASPISCIKWPSVFKSSNLIPTITSVSSFCSYSIQVLSCEMCQSRFSLFALVVFDAFYVYSLPALLLTSALLIPDRLRKKIAFMMMRWLSSFFSYSIYYQIAKSAYTAQSLNAMDYSRLWLPLMDWLLWAYISCPYPDSDSIFWGVHFHTDTRVVATKSVVLGNCTTYDPVKTLQKVEIECNF